MGTSGMRIACFNDVLKLCFSSHFLMMQGMPVPAMMMPSPYAPYPGMMMQTGPMMQMPGPPMGVTPQLTQMLAQSAAGGRGSNVFFKTRLCNK